MLRFPRLVKFVIKALFGATSRQLAPTAEVPFKVDSVAKLFPDLCRQLFLTFIANKI